MIVDATEYLQAIASAVSSSMGGTSGALLELFFTSMSSSFRGSSNSIDGGGQSILWANALQEGVAAIKFYGGADVGMRTMLVRYLLGLPFRVHSIALLFLCCARMLSFQRWMYSRK